MPKAHCLGDAMADALKSRTQITLTTSRNPEVQTEKKTNCYAVGHRGGFFFHLRGFCGKDSIRAEPGKSRTWAGGDWEAGEATA